MTETISTQPTEHLWLIGFSLDPDTASPDFYTLIFPGDRDEPLQNEGYLIFFSDPKLASHALTFAQNDYNPTIHLLPNEIDAVYDVAQTLYLLNQAEIDNEAAIVNCLNIMFDLVRATTLPMPPEYKRLLYALADHLTFERELTPFFEQQQITRQSVIDAFIWCMGAIASKFKLITQPNFNHQISNQKETIL
jgi:hypothetical protein